MALSILFILYLLSIYIVCYIPWTSISAEHDLEKKKALWSVCVT